MTIVKFVAMIFVAICAISIDAAQIQYNPQGSGSWGDSARWEGGQVPDNGDTVRIGTAAGGVHHVTVTDQDLETVLKVGTFRLYGNSTLTFAFSKTVTLSGQINVDAGGKIIKAGTAGLILSGTYAKNPEIYVESGILTVKPAATDSCKDVVFSVNSGATIEVDTAETPFMCAGMNGGGTISHTYGGTLEFRLTRSLDGAADVFSGGFSDDDDVAFSAMGAAQLLSCSVKSWRNVIKIYSGYLGLNNEALDNGDYNTIQFQGQDSGPECGILCLGGSGQCNRPMVFYGRSVTKIDAGAAGGLVINGKWTMKNAMNNIVLSGSNAIASTLANEVAEDAEGSTSASITKRGSGVWKLGHHSARKNAGLVAVEEGLLEFESIAETGEVCSLGISTLLYDPLVGKLVPYAVRLGNAQTFAASSSIPDDLATLSYTGNNAALCTTRPVVINGAGRIRNDSTASFSLRSVSSIGGGDQVLVLDGDGLDNMLEDVTDGEGTLSLVKEGSGNWTLSRNIDIGGDLIVRGGTLILDNASQKYRWYRLRVRKLAESQNDEVRYFQAREIALFDSQGVRQNLSMTYQSSANGNAESLESGAVAFGYGAFYIYNDYDLNSLFDADATTSSRVCPAGTLGYLTEVDPDEEKTWPTIVMRVSDNAEPIASYDILSYNGGTYKRAASSWVMEGSVNGADNSWVVLHEVNDNPTPVSADSRWYSSDTADFTVGYTIAPTAEKTAVAMSFVRMVELAGNATVIAKEPVTAGGIRCDANSQGGILDGFEFADDGVVELTSGGSQFTELPVTLRNAVNPENISKWTLKIDGKVSRRKIRHSKGRLFADVSGMYLIVK